VNSAKTNFKYYSKTNLKLSIEMTRFILLVAAAAFAYTSCQAQTDFKPALQKTFITFDTASTIPAKIEQSNKLSMIARKWPDAWETHYYNAYAKALLSYMEEKEEKRDAYLDEAEKEIETAKEQLKTENSETHVVEAVIANARLAVKPMSRWQKYGKIFDEHLEKAKELNKDNPRVYLVEGRSKFYTPAAFGGGAKKALPYFEKAQALYKNEKGGDMSQPYWGKEETDSRVKECKEEK
jgi:hypothetical protein